MIEMMPVAEFDGHFGWGYDGVDLFAPSHHYGTPDDFRRFVDEAHAAGVGVILDVVYNHLGPSGNYLREFSTAYFTNRYEFHENPLLQQETGAILCRKLLGLPPTDPWVQYIMSRRRPNGRCRRPNARRPTAR